MYVCVKAYYTRTAPGARRALGPECRALPVLNVLLAGGIGQAAKRGHRHYVV